MSASATLPDLISSINFNLFTLDWQTNVNQPPPEDLLLPHYPLAPFFTLENAKTTSVTFTKQSIHRLLSTSGVQKIKAKFALYPINEKEKVFTIMLVGTDARGVHTSAYYVGSPSTKKYPLQMVGSPDQDGFDDCVPTNLATVWIDNWRKIKLENIQNKLFNTSYGYLEGYTYEMNDFMDSLYPTGNINDEGLNVFFALHDHYYPGCTDTKDVRYTFGMVLQGYAGLKNLNPESFSISDPDPVNLYFDLSVPCPPTC